MEGNKVYRHEQNPEEKRLHDAFVKEHGDEDMAGIVFKPNKRGTAPSEYLTPREEKIVISTIQWLGSPIGQNWLNRMGYKKKLKKKITNNNRRYIAKHFRINSNWRYIGD